MVPILPFSGEQNRKKSLVEHVLAQKYDNPFQTLAHTFFLSAQGKLHKFLLPPGFKRCLKSNTTISVH